MHFLIVMFYVHRAAESIYPLSLCAVGPVIMSIEEKMEADGRSIYVGNVSRV